MLYLKRIKQIPYLYCMLSTTNMEYSTLKQLEMQASKLVTPLKDSTIGNHNVLLAASKMLSKSAFKDTISILETYISLQDLFDAESKYTYFDYLWGGKAELHDMSVKNVYILDRIIHDICFKKTIILLTCFEEYYVEQDKLGKNTEAISHETITILYPLKSSPCQYGAYHINPHGYANLENHEQEIYHTKTRVKANHLGEPLDHYVIGCLVSAINESLKEKSIETTLIYNKLSNKSNYMGPNLQLNDNIGICYIFPLIFISYIAHYAGGMCMYPSCEKTTTLNRLMQRGDWGQIFLLAFTSNISTYLNRDMRTSNTFKKDFYMLPSIHTTNAIAIYENFISNHYSMIHKILLSLFVDTIHKNEVC